MSSRTLAGTALVCLALSTTASIVACSLPTSPEVVDPPHDDTGLRKPTHGPIDYVPGQSPAQPPQASHPDGGKDTGPDAPEPTACNTTVLPAAGITMRGVADSLPAGAGGAIADGHYVLVESRVHGGPGTNESSVQVGTAWAFDIAGGTWQSAQITTAGSALRATSKVTTSGASGAATCECGDSCPLTTFQFTADANGLHIFHDGMFEEVFEKR